MTPFQVAAGSDCSNFTWTPYDPMTCTGKDAFGQTYEGVCGADNRCYWTSWGFKGAIAGYTTLRDQFLAKDAINNFAAFDNLRNPTAVVAYAKGAAVYLSVLQELHLLGTSMLVSTAKNLFSRITQAPHPGRTLLPANLRPAPRSGCSSALTTTPTPT
ncbi:MAG: hypothetical protein EBS29_08605 [Chloroflexia bacterium]|nr:hypothetical protein [Chloroflexia bacterium]